MENNKNLEVFSSMPVPKAVMKNALPAMAAMLMVLVYNLADTFFIGQTHNALLVAAVSLATPVYLIFMSLGTLFGIGGTSVISRALGEGNKEKARKSCAFCFWGCVFVGILLAALILIFIDPILNLIGASADTYEYAKSYLSIIVFAGPFVLISNCYGNVVRTEGESGKAMLGLLLGNLVNVILDPVYSCPGTGYQGSCNRHCDWKYCRYRILYFLFPERKLHAFHQTKRFYCKTGNRCQCSGYRCSCCFR